MQPPSPNEATGFQELLARAVKGRPTRFAFLGGGLQPLIQEAVTSGKTSPELESRFEEKANELLKQGAVGFGDRRLGAAARSQSRGADRLGPHLGWDNTGDLSAKMLRGLLERPSNLYPQLKVSTPPPATFPEHDLLDSKGALRPQWLELIQSFPDRCVLGSDSFMARLDFEEGLRRTGSLLKQLPPDLGRKVGAENAIRIYRLK